MSLLYTWCVQKVSNLWSTERHLLIWRHKTLIPFKVVSLIMHTLLPEDLSADRYSVWIRQKTTLFSGHYLHNCSTLDIGVLGYIGILYHKEHPPEVWHIPPGTPCINMFDIITSNLNCTLNYFLINTVDCYAFGD
jgi:hypothetical protein